MTTMTDKTGHQNKSKKRLVLVTGGASGIGRAIAGRLARDGCSVVIADRNLALAQQTASALQAQGWEVRAHGVDLSDEAAVRALARGLPPLGALINNAGIFDERAFDELTPQDFRRMLDVNLLPMTVLTQEAARHMGPEGRIVNMASRACLGARNHAHYVASKAAVVGYTRASAMELLPRGILVNALAPGMIDTPLLDVLGPERLQALRDLQPGAAPGRPEDVAHAAAFLASPETCFITGQVLFVDGGKSLGGGGA